MEPLMEIAKKTYIKGEKAPLKLENLMKIAKEFYRGNWSGLVVQSLIDHWNLDPETCAPRSGKLCKPTCHRKR
jgi:hypothetical protein